MQSLGPGETSLTVVPMASLTCAMASKGAGGGGAGGERSGGGEEDGYSEKSAGIHHGP